MYNYSSYYEEDQIHQWRTLSDSREVRTEFYKI